MDNIYQAIFSSSRMLLEQLDRAVCPEQSSGGPFLVLLDTDRRPMGGDVECFRRFLSDDAAIAKICNSIDDGSDPLLWSESEVTILAGQLYSERANCGYALLALPGYTFDTAHANLDLLEMLIAQLNIITALIDKNNQLHQFKLTHAGLNSKILSGSGQ